MKILYLTAFPPNRKTAGQNYSRQLLNDLCNCHSVDLIYWKYPNHELEISNKITVLKCIELPKYPLLHYLRYAGFPLFAKRYTNKISKYIISIADNYDLVYFDFSQVFRYAIDLNHHRKIGMSHDVIAQKFSRDCIYKPLLYWIKRTERKCLGGLNEIYTFSKKDSDFIESYYKRNSSPVSFYIEPEILNLDYGSIDEVEDYYVMYGAWNRNENQESIKWVLKNKISDRVNIKVIGGGMPEFLKDALRNSNIDYCGFIDNPYPIIAKSKGLIAPLFHGAGVKVKVIECLALGTPVIGNNVTFEGIDNFSVRNISALVNIDDDVFETAISDFNDITKEDKIEIRNYFLSTYGSIKLIDKL